VFTSAGEILSITSSWLSARTGAGCNSRFAEASQTFYSFEGASRLHSALASFAGGSIAVVVAAMPYKCPGAPHEGAMLIANYFRRNQRRTGMDIQLYTPNRNRCPWLGRNWARRLCKCSKSSRYASGLSYLAAVDPAGRVMRFQQGNTERYDLLVAIPPHRAPRLVKDAGLTNAAGWVPVNPERSLRNMPVCLRSAM